MTWRSAKRMSPTLRKLLLVAPMILLFSAACWAQTTVIEGDVKGEDGKPLPNAVVKIERKDVKGNYKTKTDKKGHYFYGGLPIGMYKVSIEVDGADRGNMDNVRTSLSNPAEVPFDLKANAAPAAAAEPTRDMTPQQKAEYEKKLKDSSAQMAKNKALNDAFNAGKDAATAKNWDAAVENFQKASEIDPNQHVVWGNLADAYVALAKTKTGADQQAALDKAADAYQKALAIKPDDSAYHNNYALALAQAKKFDLAQAELTKAAQLDPGQAGKYYYNLGALLVNTGQADQAADAFKKAIEIDPNYADAHYQYGIYLMGKATPTPDGKIAAPPGTAEEFQKYLQLQPTGPNADSAKAMLDSLGSTVQTQFSKQPQNQKKK
jgi:tetratricopeptide (TPR) repeat protein